MAESPAHKFGQIIGDTLEAAMEPLLREFAKKHKLYLDIQGDRPARKGKKVTWVDHNNNKHDLDYVLERGGTEKKIGEPVAFIESAWRRYTKHSRNKAQEIQGAILPLANTYLGNAPFIGVILGGVFTKGALKQLKSLNFEVLYFEYPSIIEAFKTVGINANFIESTPTSEFKRNVDKWNRLTKNQKKKITNTLIKLNKNHVDNFINALLKTITRTIFSIRILPLHGSIAEYESLAKAIDFINKYDEKNRRGAIIRYEVQIRYNNGDEISGDFKEKNNAIKFLDSYKNT